MRSWRYQRSVRRGDPPDQPAVGGRRAVPLVQHGAPRHAPRAVLRGRARRAWRGARGGPSPPARRRPCPVRPCAPACRGRRHRPAAGRCPTPRRTAQRHPARRRRNAMLQPTPIDGSNGRSGRSARSSRSGAPALEEPAAPLERRLRLRRQDERHHAAGDGNGIGVGGERPGQRAQPRRLDDDVVVDERDDVAAARRHGPVAGDVEPGHRLAAPRRRRASGATPAGSSSSDALSTTSIDASTSSPAISTAMPGSPAGSAPSSSGRLRVHTADRDRHGRRARPRAAAHHGGLDDVVERAGRRGAGLARTPSRPARRRPGRSPAPDR